jgi:hypothetical protein
MDYWKQQVLLSQMGRKRVAIAAKKHMEPESGWEVFEMRIKHTSGMKLVTSVMLLNKLIL